jgi:NDP-sugar pyrophosphorylase family protein
MNGDILSDINYKELYEHHCKLKSLFTISSCVRDNKIDYGVLHSDQNDRLSKFEEKPSIAYKVSMGIYVASSSILENIPAHTHFGFDELMYAMLKRNLPVNLYNFPGYWLDIGRPDDYAIAIDEFEKVKSKFLI